MARTIIEIVGGNIRETRKRKGFSQKELAERMGLVQNHLSRIENGDLSVGLEILERCANALKVPMAELVSSSLTEDLMVWERLAKLDELDADKREIVLKMLNAFLHEKELLNRNKSEEEQTLRELAEIRKKSQGRETNDESESEL